MKNIARHFVSARDEAGYALGMVLGVGIVLMLLIVASTTFSVSSVQSSRNDQN
jgi:hypothetical protein